MKNDIDVIIPDEEEREYIHRLIFSELFEGKFNETSRNNLINIINNLESRGAEGVILGCTEIPMLLNQEHTSLPLFDTTYIHACAAVDFALK